MKRVGSFSGFSDVALSVTVGSENRTGVILNELTLVYVAVIRRNAVSSCSSCHDITELMDGSATVLTRVRSSAKCNVIFIAARTVGNNSAIKFYVSPEGKLLAGIVRNDSNREMAISIKGLPVEWQTELNNKEKIEQLQIILTQSRWRLSGYDVEVSLKGGLAGGAGLGAKVPPILGPC